MNGLQQLKTSVGFTSCQSRTGFWGYRRHRPYFSKPLPILLFTDRKDHTTAVFIFSDRIKKCSWFLGWNSAVRLCFVKGPLNIVWELMFLRIQFKCKYRTKWTISTLHFTSHSQPWTYSVCVSHAYYNLWMPPPSCVCLKGTFCIFHDKQLLLCIDLFTTLQSAEGKCQRIGESL